MTEPDDVIAAMELERTVDLLDDAIDALRAAVIGTARREVAEVVSEAALAAYDATYAITRAGSDMAASDALRRALIEVDAISGHVRSHDVVELRRCASCTRAVRVAIERRVYDGRHSPLV